MAVLKGAVIFGHDPSAISERKCRYNFGFLNHLKAICVQSTKEGKDQESIQSSTTPDPGK